MYLLVSSISIFARAATVTSSLLLLLPHQRLQVRFSSTALGEKQGFQGCDGTQMESIRSTIADVASAVALHIATPMSMLVKERTAMLT